MKRSLNEVAGNLRKAAIGAGYPLGIADDMARAAICLVRSGLDGVAVVANALPGEAGKGLSETALKGPSLFDCILAGEESAEMSAVDTPILLVGFAMLAAEQYDRAFALKFSSGDVVTASRNGLSGGVPGGEGEVSVVVTAAIPDSGSDEISGQLNEQTDGVEINEDVLPLIKRWAMETCVPASEHSRLLGAGAGINDND